MQTNESIADRLEMHIRPLGKTMVPFGKYEGLCVEDVPVSYLDHEVSKWQRDLFCRRVKLLLDLVDEHLRIVYTGIHAERPSLCGHQSLRQLLPGMFP